MHSVLKLTQFPTFHYNLPPYQDPEQDPVRHRMTLDSRWFRWPIISSDKPKWRVHTPEKLPDDASRLHDVLYRRKEVQIIGTVPSFHYTCIFPWGLGCVAVIMAPWRLRPRTGRSGKGLNRVWPPLCGLGSRVLTRSSIIMFVLPVWHLSGCVLIQSDQLFIFKQPGDLVFPKQPNEMCPRVIFKQKKVCLLETTYKICGCFFPPNNVFDRIYFLWNLFSSKSSFLHVQLIQIMQIS